MVKCLTTYEKPEECPICLEEFNDYESIPLIPCFHWVCKKCVINSGKNECPICRQEVELTKIELKQCTKINLQRQKEKQELKNDVAKQQVAGGWIIWSQK